MPPRIKCAAGAAHGQRVAAGDAARNAEGQRPAAADREVVGQDQRRIDGVTAVGDRDRRPLPELFRVSVLLPLPVSV